MDKQHEVTMLKAADRHTHLVEYLWIIEDHIGPFGCRVYMPYASGKGGLPDRWVSGSLRRTTYPTKLERALEKGECKLKPDAKGLVRLVLDFDSKNRPQLTSLRRQKFFKPGYCPTILSEDVFQGKPDLTTDEKRKAIPSESEQKVYTKTK
ncbi:hypothetical protein BGZ89_007042 [Linnemannia elongata]|nr:hypothetical protein BGZ89_007042 [Linnemannia elongata]